MSEPFIAAAGIADRGFSWIHASPEKIAEKIAWLADHRDSLPAMRLAALATIFSHAATIAGRTWPSRRG